MFIRSWFLGLTPGISSMLYARSGVYTGVGPKRDARSGAYAGFGPKRDARSGAYAPGYPSVAPFGGLNLFRSAAA
jgi:hypothetical protein